jgi:hypothetical protein
LGSDGFDGCVGCHGGFVRVDCRYDVQKINSVDIELMCNLMVNDEINS